MCFWNDGNLPACLDLVNLQWIDSRILIDNRR